MHVDDTDLYVFNDRSMSSLIVVIKAQRMLFAWYEALKFTGGYLKLFKCYWNFQDYLWQNGKCSYSSSKVSTIDISTESSSILIDNVPSEKMKIFVGVPITLYNDSGTVVSLYQCKIKDYIIRLKCTNLNPQDVIFAYERYCLP